MRVIKIILIEKSNKCNEYFDFAFNLFKNLQKYSILYIIDYCVKEEKFMMEKSEIIVSFDHVGRLTIPAKFRKMLNITYRDYIEIFINSDNIILQKHKESCIFCGRTKEIKSYKGKNICSNCFEELHNK